MSTPQPQPAPYGERMRQQRDAAGLSLVAARDRLRDTIPHRYVPSVKTLQRIELGDVAEHKVDGIVVVGLAQVYGCRVSDLSTTVADELERVSDLLSSSSRCTLRSPGQLALLAA